MSRRARVVLPGVPYHLTQRGVGRKCVFFDRDDYRFYYRLLKKMAAFHGVFVHGYSWMPNHVHVVAVPETEQSFARTFRRVNSTYALYFNQKYESSGYLWQGRFFSCALDDRHYRTAIRYVERNAVRAGLVERAEDYEWSSARSRCGFREDELLVKNLPLLSDIGNWAEWLAGGNDSSLEHKIRRNTDTGWPCGSEEFIDACEEKTGRILRPQRVGRKRK
jgi:putative transposase